MLAGVQKRNIPGFFVFGKNTRLLANIMLCLSLESKRRLVNVHINIYILTF